MKTAASVSYKDPMVGKGFTLIELLIVIAIILILISIALPNFLEAQIRAKVVRVTADQRTIGIATDEYFLDRKTYMPYNAWGNHNLPAYFNALTTPIALLKNADSVHDPFYDEEIDDFGYDRYGYYSDGITPYRKNMNSTWQSIRSQMRLRGIRGWRTSRYCITSSGPDSKLNIDKEDSLVLYTPTNGSSSRGDILRFGPM
jgi:prepilin-type N-terminal cleavage/methylation domain-containing protein